MKPILTIKSRPDTPAMVEAALACGITAFRINFARRSPAENLALAKTVRRLAGDGGRDCVIFGDTPGTKFRLMGPAGLELGLREGERVSLTDLAHAGLADWAVDAQVLATVGTHPGARVLFATGVELVFSRSCPGGHAVEFAVTRGGPLYRGAGFNLDVRDAPYSRLSDADRRLAGLMCGCIDILALSFADTPELIADARKIVGTRMKIVAKIETAAAVARLPQIMCESDGAMLARGDLASHFSIPQMSAIGARIQGLGRDMGRIAVFATDYFKPLAESGRFDWAEHPDLADACRAAPDYLLVNETSYTPHWREIIRVCAELWSGGVKIDLMQQV